MAVSKCDTEWDNTKVNYDQVRLENKHNDVDDYDIPMISKWRTAILKIFFRKKVITGPTFLIVIFFLTNFQFSNWPTKPTNNQSAQTTGQQLMEYADGDMASSA